jgi:hypothetical protein
VAPSHAAMIDWAPVTNIAGDTDVSTNGTVVGAFNLGDSGVATATANGVMFQPFAISGGSNTYTVGNFTFANADTFENVAPAATTTWRPLTVAYESLLTSAVTLKADRLLTLTMTGLTVGQTYEFQTWVNNSNRQNGFNNNLYETTVSDGTNEVNLYAGDNGADREIPPVPGQYVIGTFTADATSQIVTFQNGEINGWVNGFQVRAIPEPGTVALVALGLAVGAGFLRHRVARTR